MSKSCRTVILTKIMMTRATNNKNKTNHEPSCMKCGIGFMIGQVIVTKRANSYVKWYHEDCAREANVI